jgi:organic radical activating enzyme
MSETSKRVTLTKAQSESPVGKELIDLLVRITYDDLLNENGLWQLSVWLNTKKDSEITAIQFLSDTFKRVHGQGRLTAGNLSEIQFAIERVIPKDYRQFIAEKRRTVKEQLPASKAMLKCICDRGGNPPPGITRAEAYELKEELYHQPTQKQLEYIRALGGNPTPDLTRFTAMHLIEELLQTVKATEKQLDFIRSLGGNPPQELSRAGAEELIPRLLAEQHEKQAREKSPTPRQMMVPRFWNRTDLVNASQWEIEQWLDKFYHEDPRRKEAWEIFKKENHDDGSQRDPSWVPIGIGENFLSKCRLGQSESANG